MIVYILSNNVFHAQAMSPQLRHFVENFPKKPTNPQIPSNHRGLQGITRETKQIMHVTLLAIGWGNS